VSRTRTLYRGSWWSKKEKRDDRDAIEFYFERRSQSFNVSFSVWLTRAVSLFDLVRKDGSNRISCNASSFRGNSTVRREFFAKSWPHVDPITSRLHRRHTNGVSSIFNARHLSVCRWHRRNVSHSTRSLGSKSLVCRNKILVIKIS